MADDSLIFTEVFTSNGWPGSFVPCEVFLASWLARVCRGVHSHRLTPLARGGNLIARLVRFVQFARGVLHLWLTRVRRGSTGSGSLGAGAAFSPVRFTLVGRGILSCGSLHSHAVCRCQRFPWVMRGFRS